MKEDPDKLGDRAQNWLICAWLLWSALLGDIVLLITLGRPAIGGVILFLLVCLLVCAGMWWHYLKKIHYWEIEYRHGLPRHALAIEQNTLYELVERTNDSRYVLLSEVLDEEKRSQEYFYMLTDQDMITIGGLRIGQLFAVVKENLLLQEGLSLEDSELVASGERQLFLKEGFKLSWVAGEGFYWQGKRVTLFSLF